jgi:single-stranded DNA-specific DHH superfamily exonuclease
MDIQKNLNKPNRNNKETLAEMLKKPNRNDKKIVTEMREEVIQTQIQSKL